MRSYFLERSFLYHTNNIHHVHTAIKYGIDAFAKEAIDNKKIDVNLELKEPISGDEEKTLLLQAMKYRRTEIIELLLAKGANVDVADNEGNTPLHILTDRYVQHINRSTDIAAALIKNKANLNLQNKWGHTPLHLAIIQENEKIAQLLLENEANVNLVDYQGETPLHHLLARPAHFPLIANLLLEKGADGNIQNSHGNTPLHQAIDSLPMPMWKYLEKLDSIPPEEEKLSISYRAIAISLIEKGANLNLQNIDGNTPLHIAIHKKDEEILNLLLKKGANVNLTNCQGETPLHSLLAWPAHFPLIANLLLERGADVNIQNSLGNTPLHQAIFSLPSPRLNYHEKLDIMLPQEEKTRISYRAIATFLIEKGANLNLQNRDGYAPLHIAIHEKDEEILNLLLKKGADVNLKDRRANTPLHLAVIEGEITVVTTILDRIKPLDLEMRGEGEKTPLHLAVSKGHKAIINKLLNYGANRHCRDEKGNSLLHTAVVCRTLGAVSSLLEDKDNLNLQNSLGETPLYLAVSKGDIKVVDTLIMQDADINLADHNGICPLLVAAINRRENIMNSLLRRGGKLFGPESESQKSTLLFVSAYTGKVDDVKQLIDEYFVDINWQDARYRGVLLNYVNQRKDYKEIRNCLEIAYVTYVMWDLWEMPIEQYTSFLQWLPREMVEDVQSFVRGGQCFFEPAPLKRKRENTHDENSAKRCKEEEATECTRGYPI